MEEASLLDALKAKKVLGLISKFTSQADLCRLSMAGKQYRLLLKDRYRRQIKAVDEFICSKVQQLDKKKAGKKSEQEEIVTREANYVMVKTNVWQTPAEVFQTRKLWKHVKGVLPFKAPDLLEKLTSGTYAFFVHKNNEKEVFFLNRSLIDRGLEYDKGGFQPDNQEEGLYANLYEGKEMTQKFDFSSQASLRERQKQIVEAINEKKQKRETDVLQALELGVENITQLKRISVILCFGGYFSMGIFEKSRCILHKSDHKYVCRKKAGGRQLNKDKCSGTNIQSMGSEIRRHQEKLHQEKVSNILTEHFAELEKSDMIFLQAPGINRLLLISEDEVLFKLKHKLRSVCLTAKKANYTEVERIYEAITKIYLVKFDV